MQGFKCLRREEHKYFGLNCVAGGSKCTVSSPSSKAQLYSKSWVFLVLLLQFYLSCIYTEHLNLSSANNVDILQMF